ncbi:secondary thiamine-phosphate synthase enzyme YjbQ [Clostridium polynesiense]|uniref:secondary thiamine-phosphate synthase enzyme YjbQ n=1 Tax=Clostridium polynesiense TaxID=1325933 RepID=UPI00058CCED0|nr:secondary thiamine-phosphate synthase enzyme YjbQ [Clostridium polynesiense]
MDTLYNYQINTRESDEFIDITAKVSQCVAKSKVESGIALVYCPHTTAAITINENADDDVKRDMIYWLDKIYPQDSNFKHMEGNSPSHLKSSAFGSSQSIIINEGKLLLGTWQGIYFCEFDGPRMRNFYVKIIKDV